MSEGMTTTSRWNRRRIGVTILLFLLFICSVWNWLYNIPVQPNVEIPFAKGSWWMVDAARPNNVLVWNKKAGPVSCYDVRTGNHLYDRLSPSDLDVRISPGAPHTAIVYRHEVHTVVDLRTDTVRCQIPDLPEGINFQSYQDGRVLIAIQHGVASAFDADTGALLWKRDDIHSVRSNWGAQGDLVCAEVYYIQEINGQAYRKHNCQVLRVRDGQRDERFDVSRARQIWMPMPPIYLVEEGPPGAAVNVYDVKTGAKRLTIEQVGMQAAPYFNSDLTEILLPCRAGEYGCRLARWDLKTGKVIEPPDPVPHVIGDLITDDGRFSIGRFMIDSPPGYGLLRAGLAELGIQLPPRERETLLLVDNHAGKVVGKLEYRTQFNRVELKRTGDAFFQECDDRLAVYFLPIQLNWSRLCLGAAWMLISFVATTIKLWPLLAAASRQEIVPEQKDWNDEHGGSEPGDGA